MMALWPDRFWMKLPSGNIHCLMLSAEPEANVYLKNTGNKMTCFYQPHLFSSVLTGVSGKTAYCYLEIKKGFVFIIDSFVDLSPICSGLVLRGE